MGLFNFLKKRGSPTTEQATTEQATTHVRDIKDPLLEALISGQTITREQAITLPAVAGAVDFISNIIASMPVKLYKHKQGKVEELPSDTRVKLLNSDTGDTLDGFQLKKAMVEDYLLGKGGYAYIRKYRNEVTGLFYVQDDFVVIEPVTFNPVVKDYRIIVRGQEYKPYEFIKLLRKTKDGAQGEGVTSEVSKALETAYQTLIYQLNLVKSGGNKRGFLKATKKLGQEEVNALKKAWRDLYANNSSTVAVLNNGVDFQEASNSSVEMQLNESKKTLQDEINNIFHIKDDFYDTFKEAIYPIIKAFETALNRDLLLEKEKKNLFFEFDVKEILKANLKERYEAYKLAKETGFMTLNEIRRAENMEFVEGMDVVNVGLGAVLYDINSHKYFTPNTNSTTDLNTQKLIEDKEIDTAFEESGNSSDG